MSALLFIARAEQLERAVAHVQARLEVLQRVKTLRENRATFLATIALIDRELDELAEPLRLALLDLTPADFARKAR